MNWGQLILQLGISGAVLFVAYQLGLVAIKNWSKSDGDRNIAWAKSESERNLAWAKSDSERTLAIQEGFRADVQAHQEITKTMQTLANQFFRIEGKLDTVLDLTPVREMHAMSELVPDLRTSSEAKVVVDPVLKPERIGRNTPLKGVQTIRRDGK